jgi:biotin carboxyl carrier protein
MKPGAGREKDGLRYDIEVEGRWHKVVVHRIGGGFAVEVDGRAWRVDAAHLDAHTMSLIVSAMWSKGDTDDGVSRQFFAQESDGRARGGSSYEVVIMPDGASGRLDVRVGSTSFEVTLNGRRRVKDQAGDSGTGPERIEAPMPGKVVRVLAHPGQVVSARQSLVVVEAMKMQNELRASRGGTVSDVRVAEGASVEVGTLLMVIV